MLTILAFLQVPDWAKVREKMLYSSSKSRLLKALGEASFTDSLHATAPADLTVRGYAVHLAAQAAPHPLTERERALQEVKQAEYEASKEDAFRGTGGGVRGGAGPLSAVMGVGAGLEWGEGVEDALKEIAGESSGASGDKRKVVGLQIDPKVNTRLNLALSTSATLDELRTHLPTEGPQYTIFSHLPAEAVPSASQSLLGQLKHRPHYPRANRPSATATLWQPRRHQPH